MGIGQDMKTWLRVRLGKDAADTHSVCEQQQSGTRFPHITGLMTVTCLGILFITGLFMAMYFQPSPQDAWNSVKFIEKSVPLGWFMRGLHRWGALLIMFFMLVHLASGLIRARYYAPQEFVWLLGVVMLILVCALVITGFFVPWDFKAYWGVKTIANWLKDLPLISGILKWIIFTDAPNGAVPIGRWFTIHVLLLPLVVSACLWGHVTIFRRLNPQVTTQKTGWLRWLVVGVVLVAASLLSIFGVEHQDIADPVTTSDVPQPNWLFLMFFQATRYCQDSMEMVGVFWGPMFLIVLLLLPVFIDFRRGGRIAKWLLAFVMLVAIVGVNYVTYHTGSTTPTDSCAACHKEGFGESFSAPPTDLAKFSYHYDNKWLALHYRYPQYFWMMDADVPLW